ncbi:hypothetical protein CALVIDRAFT_528519 [Calocera viscosa TUFC12733]|uniref:Uncharacterized protein n=1 Tax=Calocera viscosa (strain TUFC12733) TaxID=1330018 RepID=A0A167KQ87_CALVF|nr:hypothetical protein CALVIDRAFT_528519 [Calocera viscosa TUFC12733]
MSEWTSERGLKELPTVDTGLRGRTKEEVQDCVDRHMSDIVSQGLQVLWKSQNLSTVLGSGGKSNYREDVSRWSVALNPFLSYYFYMGMSDRLPLPVTTKVHSILAAGEDLSRKGIGLPNDEGRTLNFLQLPSEFFQLYKCYTHIRPGGRPEPTRVINDDGIMKLRYRENRLTKSVFLNWDRRGRVSFCLLFKRLFAILGEVPSLGMPREQHVSYQTAIRGLWTVCEKGRRHLHIGQYPGELQVLMLEHALHARNILWAHDVHYSDTILQDDYIPTSIARFAQGRTPWLWMQAPPLHREGGEHSAWWSRTIDQRAPYVRDHIDATFGDDLVDVILADVVWELHAQPAAIDVYIAATLDSWCRMCGVRMNTTMTHNLSILLKQLNKLVSPMQRTPSETQTDGVTDNYAFPLPMNLLPVDGLSSEHIRHCPLMSNLDPLGIDCFERDTWTEKFYATVNKSYSSEEERVRAGLMYASFDEEAVNMHGRAFNELAMGYVNSALIFIHAGNKDLEDCLPDLVNIPTYIRQDHIESFAFSEAQHLDVARKYVKETRLRVRGGNSIAQHEERDRNAEPKPGRKRGTIQTEGKTVRFVAGTKRSDGPTKKPAQDTVPDTVVSSPPLNGLFRDAAMSPSATRDAEKDHNPVNSDGDLNSTTAQLIKPISDTAGPIVSEEPVKDTTNHHTEEEDNVLHEVQDIMLPFAPQLLGLPIELNHKPTGSDVQKDVQKTSVTGDTTVQDQPYMEPIQDGADMNSPSSVNVPMDDDESGHPCTGWERTTSNMSHTGEGYDTLLLSSSEATRVSPVVPSLKVVEQNPPQQDIEQATISYHSIPAAPSIAVVERTCGQAEPNTLTNSVDPSDVEEEPSPKAPTAEKNGTFTQEVSDSQKQGARNSADQSPEQRSAQRKRPRKPSPLEESDDEEDLAERQGETRKKRRLFGAERTASPKSGSADPSNASPDPTPRQRKRRRESIVLEQSDDEEQSPGHEGATRMKRTGLRRATNMSPTVSSGKKSYQIVVLTTRQTKTPRASNRLEGTDVETRTARTVLPRNRGKVSVTEAEAHDTEQVSVVLYTEDVVIRPVQRARSGPRSTSESAATPAKSSKKALVNYYTNVEDHRRKGHVYYNSKSFDKRTMIALRMVKTDRTLRKWTPSDGYLIGERIVPLRVSRSNLSAELIREHGSLEVADSGKGFTYWRHGAFRCQTCQQRTLWYMDKEKNILADECKPYEICEKRKRGEKCSACSRDGAECLERTSDLRSNDPETKPCPVPCTVYDDARENQGEGDPLDEYGEEYDDGSAEEDNLHFLPAERQATKAPAVNDLWNEKLALLGLPKESNASKSERDSKRRADNREKTKQGIPRDPAKDKFRKRSLRIPT